VVSIACRQTYLCYSARRQYEAGAGPPFTLFFHPTAAWPYFNNAILDTGHRYERIDFRPYAIIGYRIDVWVPTVAQAYALTGWYTASWGPQSHTTGAGLPRVPGTVPSLHTNARPASSGSRGPCLPPALVQPRQRVYS
jgi:hypothetical protein